MPGDAALRLLISINANPAEALRAFASLAGGASGLGTALLAVGVAVAAVAVGLGIAAVKAAANFQQGLLRLVTGAGDVTDNMTKMGQAILGVSIDTGVAAGDLNKAMYLIISSGQRGAQALDTLSVAARGAVIEQANVVDVANVLSGVMTNYGTKMFSATQFMNGLIRAVQLGKITLQNLAVAMGPIDPIAKSLGISFNDVAAAMTTQTNAMIPAARAATGLRFMMLALENPTKKATDAMAALGLKSADVANEMKKSLPGALQMIYDAAKRAGPEGSVPFDRAISDMVGGIRSFTAFTALTGPHMQDFIKNSKAILAAMEANKNAVTGWDTASSGFNVQLSKVNASFQALLITIGSLLLPVLTNLLAGVMPIIQSFIDWFSNTDNVQGALAILTSTIAPLVSAVQDTWTYLQPLIAGLIDWAIKNDVAGKALAAVKIYVQLLAAEIRFMVPIIVSVIQAVVAFVASLWSVLAPGILTMVDFIRTHWMQISAIFSGVWGIIVGIVKVAWAIVSGIILVGVDILTGHWGKAWSDFKDTLKKVWDGILTYLRGAIKLILGVMALIPGSIGDAARASLKALDTMNAGVKKSSLDMQKAVVANMQAMVAGLQTQLDNATSTSQRHFIQMKLDAATQSLALQTAVLKNLQGMVDGSNTKLGTMATDADKNALAMAKNVKNRLIQLNTDVIGHSIIPDMITAIGAAFIKMAADALTWGTNMINNFVAGILSGLAAAIAAATAIANAVAKILHHSTPTEGPLKGDDLWGYHFGMNIADGIRRSIPAVQSASMLLASAMGGNYSGSYSLSGTIGGRYPTGGGVVINAITIMPPSIKLDGAEVTDKIMRRAAKETRVQGFLRNR